MVTKSTKDIENIVMDTCVRVKYDGDGLSGAFNGCCFAQRVSEKGRVCHWLSPMTSRYLIVSFAMATLDM